MKITAAVSHITGEPLDIQKIGLNDDLKADEILVKTVASGICGADIQEAQSGGPTGHAPLPMVLGHEGAGIVEKVGSGVTEFELGDHVTVSYASCGTCSQCIMGRPYACERMAELNFGGRDTDGGYRYHSQAKNISSFFQQSAFGTYMKVQARNVIKVTKDVDLRMLGPLGCGLQTGSGTVLNDLRPQPGAGIVVFGTGTVGLSAIMAAKVAHCDPIIAVDILDSRLETALDMGATHVINSQKRPDVSQEVNRIQAGGVEFAVVSAGINGLAELATRSTGIYGTIAIVGGAFKGEFNLAQDVLIPARTIRGVLQGSSLPKVFIPKLIKLYQAEHFPFDRLIKFYDLDNVNQAFADSQAGKVVKPVLVMPSR
ncbi:aryl-alcohol dehydrogenase [Levilactobacillus brevis]|uniref:Benzyl alcohol dehydrogenase EC n=2 Tax=Levilactobacillus brevis TaxID=1580 RepID=A0A5B7XYF0_LEVBR|nr:NAD(P)-dependent alcohol dehydrogenase [Levilactobacillus brevis]AJA79285.1 alcohol dehydrogenase [Levilactobacillus brevis BSO 464]OLF66239.1 aryl-alcohol dehydrogenase [Levilactobacillus brevis]QCZ48797.1 benzyl alcohol dehydrogenase EC [Levilactobacillus brevis]QCZ52765.1 benzyl alcohol dehydrogenase EC [Levilactobacillus brevis]